MTEEGARTRWMFRLWVILAVLGVVPNTSVAEPAGGQIVRLIPSTMPPSRTYCVLEDADGTFSSTVDWDPLVPRALIRDIRVPGRLAKARQ